MSVSQGVCGKQGKRWICSGKTGAKQVNTCIHFTYPCGWLGADMVSEFSGSYIVTWIQVQGHVMIPSLDLSTHVCTYHTEYSVEYLLY